MDDDSSSNQKSSPPEPQETPSRLRSKATARQAGFASLWAELKRRHVAAYLVLGDHDKAIETLEAASKMESYLFLNRELDLWFIFDRLRGNPRFDKLLED